MSNNNQKLKHMISSINIILVMKSLCLIFAGSTWHGMLTYSVYYYKHFKTRHSGHAFSTFILVVPCLWMGLVFRYCTLLGQTWACLWMLFW